MLDEAVTACPGVTYYLDDPALPDLPISTNSKLADTSENWERKETDK